MTTSQILRFGCGFVQSVIKQNLSIFYSAMKKCTTQFLLEDGTSFLAEVEEPQGMAIEQVSVANTGQIVYQAKQTLEQALVKVKPVISAVLSQLNVPDSEVEFTFGLKLNAESGIVFSSVGSEVSFEVKVKKTSGQNLLSKSSKSDEQRG